MVIKKRIDWIDIAKGVAIILVIIGHTVGFGTFARNMIFSFHMPLFFILSGYTMRLSDEWSKYPKCLWKDIYHLILPIAWLTPYYLLRSMQCIYQSFTLDALKASLLIFVHQLYWASGVAVGNDVPALGIPWFFVSLFTAKQLISLVYLILHKLIRELDQKKRTLLLCVVLIIFCAIGVNLGLTNRWQHFNFDVSLIASFFVGLGILARTYVKETSEFIVKNRCKNYLAAAICLICFGFWAYCLHKGIYIELASRGYMNPLITIIEAIAGSLLFIMGCSFTFKGSHISKVLCFLGRNSLYILLAHCISWPLNCLWQQTDIVEKCLVRSIVTVIVGCIIIELINLCKKLLSFHRKCSD